MAGGRTPGVWSRQRLAVVLGTAALVGVTAVAGLGIAVFRLVTASVEQPAVVAAGTPATASNERDQVASAQMVEVAQDAGFVPDPALTPAAAILVPTATNGRGPAGVATGFPQTPEGAVAQLAAIEQAVLEAMSLPLTRDVHAAWTLPGAAGFEQWELTENVRAFLRSGQQGGQEKDVTTTVSATPAMAMVKGTDGPDWVVACVLLDIQASIRTDARMGYGHCSRMQWTDGRWQVAPGAAPAKAPSAWPGSVAAVDAGWLTWQEVGA